MPVVAYEPKILSDLVKYEFEPSVGYCRKKVSFKNSSGLTLAAFTVLGKRLVGASATATAKAGNTGNGTMGSVTLSGGVSNGTYVVRITGEDSDGGEFEVLNPVGAVIGTGEVGVEFDEGGLTFTLADGATDFEEGDAFTITVTGNWEYDVCTEGAVDGTATPAGVYIGNVSGQFGLDTVVEAATAVDLIALVRGPVVVGKDELVIDDSFATADEVRSVYDQLEALGFLVGDQV